MGTPVRAMGFKGVGVGHEKLKDVPPAGAKAGVGRRTPWAFFFGNLRQATSVVRGEAE